MMATASGFNAGGRAPHPGWFARNWKWSVPLGCLGVILVIALFVGGILLAVASMFNHSDAYRIALEKAQANAMVVEKIGRPLKAGWLSSGHINVSGSSGDADIAIPVSGPKGKGKLYVVAKKSAGVWHFETLQVQMEGESEPIDLLKSEEKAPTG